MHFMYRTIKKINSNLFTHEWSMHFIIGNYNKKLLKLYFVF